jgi:hypothetical protein
METVLRRQCLRIRLTHASALDLGIFSKGPIRTRCLRAVADQHEALAFRARCSADLVPVTGQSLTAEASGSTHDLAAPIEPITNSCVRENVISPVYEALHSPTTGPSKAATHFNTRVGLFLGSIGPPHSLACRVMQLSWATDGMPETYKDYTISQRGQGVSHPTSEIVLVNRGLD